MKSGQVNLQLLFIVLTITAVVFRAARLAGWTSVAWISVVAFLLFLSCFAWAVAPRATTHAVALLAIGTVLLSLLVCWIDQARTLARQQRASNNLRQLGMGLLEQQNSAFRATGPYDAAPSKDYAHEMSGPGP